jgi:hypothetical protein
MTKTQLGWRRNDAEKTLYLPLFRLGYQEEVHLAPYGDVTKAWNDFLNLLKTDPEFPKGEFSVETIKKQWNKRINDHKTLFGIDIQTESCDH